MIDHNEISETNEKILRAVLEDDDILFNGVVSVIKDVYDNVSISEIIYLFLDGNKELIEEILSWDLNSMKESK